MKIKLGLALVFVVATALYASFIVPYNNSKIPTLLLDTAYDQANKALGSLTNQFHCVSARITTDFGPEGEWQFTFYSTNSIPKWVTVEFKGKIHIENIKAR
jgi:hypothetical protein